MRILFVTLTYEPFFERGAPPVKVRAMAEGLTRRGRQVTVLTSRYGRALVTRCKINNGVEVVYLRPFFTCHATTLNWGLLRFCRKRLPEFDVVHIFGLYDLLGPVITHSA